MNHILKGEFKLSKNVVDTYDINEHTLALLPAKHIEYQTKVLEQDRELYVRMTPLEIVKYTCYNEWCTYEGRRDAVTYHTNFKRKIPIPINIQKQIYIFPTDSPSDFDNIWISLNHIIHTKKSTQDAKKSIVFFSNKTKLTINISHYSLRKQIDRTFECKFRIENFIRK